MIQKIYSNIEGLDEEEAARLLHQMKHECPECNPQLQLSS